MRPRGPVEFEDAHRALLHALKRGSQLGERGEVPWRGQRGLAADDVRKRCDRDLEARAERLVFGASLEIFVAVGAARAPRDVELPGVGGEVEDLGARRQPRVGRSRPQAQ
jgi:hypothetical protein